MTVQPYEQVIVDGLQGLPQEALVEIADFIYFVRKRILHEEAIEDELFAALLRADFKQNSRDEEHHFEREIEENDNDADR